MLTLHTVATFQDDGNGVSPTIVNTWDDDQGWVVVEAVLLRLYIQNAPNVSFPVHSYHEPSIVAPSSGEIGYDVGVCVHMYEPWIIEMYNSSIASPSALQIVGKGNSSTPLLPSGNIRGTPIANTRYLNTTGKTIAFEMALFNSIDTIKNENGRDGIYTNSPIVSPAVPLRATCLLTLLYSAGRFYHRRQWTFGIHRTLSRSACHYPCTDWCGLHFTIPRGVSTRYCTIVQRRDISICHLQGVATDLPPGPCLDPGNHRRAVRASVTAKHPTERIWSL